MSIKSLRGREQLIGPSFKVDLPIELDPAENEGAIVYTNDGVHFFSDGQKWISFAELIADIRRPTILSPEEGETIPDLTPSIVGSPRSSLFGDSATLNRRFQIRKLGNGWTNSIVDVSLQQDSAQVQPGTLEFLTDYQVRIRDEDSLGNVSGWSIIVNFSTSNNVVTPENLSPEDNKIDVLQTDNLVASIFETAVFDETHTSSEFEIEEVNGNGSYNSGSVSPTRSIEVPNSLHYFLMVLKQLIT